MDRVLRDVEHSQCHPVAHGTNTADCLPISHWPKCHGRRRATANCVPGYGQCLYLGTVDHKNSGLSPCRKIVCNLARHMHSNS